ncbi:MAG: T9SS type A sorting domain-containing protein [Flavobacteriales bacterium]|nr:T9SS type A sorting domain-containing protein [Flavobacteriales bacterium]
MKKAKQFLLLTGIFILTFTANAQWTQVGIDIDGEAINDYSGETVSMSADGLTVAIGALRNDGSATDAGHVRVYKNISGTWTQLGGDIDGETAGDNSGSSLSISSDGLTVAIGADGNDDGGSSAGHVRVYKYILGVWTQQGIDIDGEATSDKSGRSVGLSGDGTTVIIGAFFNDGNGTDAGHARVYKLISGTWTQLGLDINGSAVNGYAGTSVSISDDGLTVAVGEPNTGAGRVSVYKYISSLWVLQGATIVGEANGDYAGIAVSLADDGLTVAIGAEANNGTGLVAGHVRVYKFITSTWVQQGTDIDGEAIGDQSGSSVSLSSDGLTVAIGATNNGGNGPISGHVRVYELILGTWTQQPADINGEAANDYSGKSVGLSSNGHTVIIGAYFNDGNGAESGHARVYSNCTATISTDVQTACVTYLWIDGNTYTSSNTTATHTLPNAAGCDSVVTLNLTINALPTVTASGAATICDGQSTNLAAGGASTYAWDNGAGTGSPVSVSPSTTTTYTVTGTDGNTCVNTAQVTVTVNTLPTVTASGTVTICDGQSTNLTAGGASTYAWDNGAGAGTPVSVSPSTTTTYTVTGTDGNSCVNTAQVTVTVNALPDVTVTTATNLLTANNVNAGVTYQWLDCNNNDAIIASETAQNYAVTISGSYAVEVTENGCVDTSVCNNVVFVGINENSFGSSFTVYPNPTSGNVRIALGGIYKNITLKVMNVTGQLIDEKIYQTTNQINYELKVKTGVYFIKITSANKEQTTIKIIKQ